MCLEVQLQSMIFSLLYGIFFSLLLSLNYKILFTSKKVTRVIASVLFVIDNVFLYFIILCHINGGMLHIYFMMLLVVGFVLGNFVIKILRFKILPKLKKKHS